MRVFVTGASGWIGSAVVDDLLAAGHEVLGLARSERSAFSLEAKGAAVQRGDLDDLDSLRAGSAAADAVIHLANKHDFANPQVSNSAERAAVETIGEALAGSGRTFVLASGVAIPGYDLVTEDTASPHHGPDSMRGGSENRALEFVDHGVAVVSARFSPTVHAHGGDHGFISVIVNAARENGVSAFIEDGANRWPAVHRLDAARMVRLGLEKAIPGSVLHAVSEEGVTTRTIAEAIGRGLGLPVQSIAAADAAAHFGWIGGFFGLDIPASSVATQELLGWTPTGPTLIDDLDSGAYFPVPAQVPRS